MMIPLEHYLIISALLFCFGVIIIIIKKNAIMVLMGIELILNASNINLVAFSQYDPLRIQGQFFALFVIVVAAAEASVALAIVLRVFDYFKTVEMNKVEELKD